MADIAPASGGSRAERVLIAALGALLGGLVGGFVVVGVTLVLKAGMEFVARQATPVLIVVPALGLLLATLILHGIGRSGSEDRSRGDGGRAAAWRTFPTGAIRSDISADVTASGGQEERFPWRLAPIRAAAILATVGLGGAMGTEAPAAYLGVAAGACLGDRGHRWRRLLRPAALAGGAAGIAALMRIPLVGAGYMLEFGRRHKAPLSLERIAAALVGGFVGWGIDLAFGLNLIRLIVPEEPPSSFTQGVITALFIGALAGGMTSVAALAIYRAKKWQASPAVRLVVGGGIAMAAAVALVVLAEPRAAVGPGGGAILWAERDMALPRMLLAVAILRTVATSAAVAAGGCGGVFVPFLAIGDIGGRVFAPGLEIGHDLAGAAGAAAGIAGGYRLPITALAMDIWLGGPHLATLTCVGAIGVAYLVAVGVGAAGERIKKRLLRWKLAKAPGGRPFVHE